MEQLTQIGLVGTSRHAISGVADAEHPADAMLAALTLEDRERFFLLNAGVRAVFDRCGYTAVAGCSPLSPSPPETLPCASPKVVDLLKETMQIDQLDVFVEFLRHMQATHCLLPPELLPDALSIKSGEVRKHLSPILGQRGRWLAAMNPEWQWATRVAAADIAFDRESLARQWEEGNIGERCQAIQTLRRSDPSEARRWIEAAIGQEKAENRVRLVESLAIALGAEDEPFLESLLDDRSEQVRRASAACLAKLPGSALAKRMAERAAGILALQKPGILRRSPRLTCNAPEEIDADWVRDGVPAKTPAGRGKRAVWTEAVLAAVPPGMWQEQFSLQPAELIQAIVKDDFAEAVLVGWTRAATTFAESDAACEAWMTPLADYWLASIGEKDDPTGSNALGYLQELTPRMPVQDAEALLSKILKQTVAKKVPGALSLLAALPRPWSQPFSLEYLTTVRSVFQQPPDLSIYPWTSTLKLAGRALPRDAFAAALAPWSVGGAEVQEHASQAMAREVADFTETIRIRQRFYSDVCDPIASPAASTHL